MGVSSKFHDKRISFPILISQTLADARFPGIFPRKFFLRDHVNTYPQTPRLLPKQEFVTKSESCVNGNTDRASHPHDEKCDDVYVAVCCLPQTSQCFIHDRRTPKLN